MKLSTIFRALVPSLALLSALAIGGCKDEKASGGDKQEKKDEGKSEKKEGKTASCNLVTQESLCRQYAPANVEAVGEKDLKSLCDGLKGDFKMEACPKEKRVGSCVTPEGTKVFYSEGPLPLSAEQAEKSCKEGVPAGAWKP